jgi:hypothetical protein
MRKTRRAGRWLVLGLAAVSLAGCAQWGAQKQAAESTHYYAPRTVAEFNRLSPAERIRYFTDNVYLAAVSHGADRGVRLAAAETALDELRKQLDAEAFVNFWTGVDPEFFGRVNAGLEYADYTHPQVALGERQMRTVYNLGARHLTVLKNLSAARRQAMQDLIDLADKGDGAACFTFYKAYKNYANPLQGEAGIGWLDVDGRPFRKSMWSGSAEASYQGRIVQIAIPPQAVLGCRNILHPPPQLTAGVVEDAEQFFSGINLSGHFDAADYARHKLAWQQEMMAKAAEAARRIHLDKIRIVNVVDVYRIFPPALDYEYEMAVADGTLPELVSTGILTEQQAFEVEQRIHERRVLLTGEGVTPEHTPMAFLQLVADRVAAKK